MCPRPCVCVCVPVSHVGLSVSGVQSVSLHLKALGGSERAVLACLLPHTWFPEDRACSVKPQKLEQSL